MGPWAGAPPLGPLGLEVEEPLCGVPGTVGVAGFADRILSGVQYPEFACDGGAVWLAPFCANTGRANTLAEITSTSVDRIADAKLARKQWMLIRMTEPPW